MTFQNREFGLFLDFALTCVACQATGAQGDGISNMVTAQKIAIIWDLDGTLADTEQAHFRAWTSLCARFGRTVTWDDFKPTFGLGNQDILRMLIWRPSPIKKSNA